MLRSFCLPFPLLCPSDSPSFLLSLRSQKLTLSLIQAKTSDAPTLEVVTAKFEEVYQGKEGVPGLKDVETLIPAKGGVGAGLVDGAREAVQEQLSMSFTD